MSKKYGLLFPGQGSQSVGMGKALYESDAAARWVFTRANEILGRDITKLCFEGPEEELQTTANSQPAIFITSIATLAAFAGAASSVVGGASSVVGGASGPEQSAVIASQPEAGEAISEAIKNIGTLAMGLSLGEPTALVAAGAISFEDGLKFVEKRGQFMEEASREKPGKMASIIGLELEKIEELCIGIGGCTVANLNSPGQVVISGYAERVDLVADLAKEKGAKRVIMLKVSGAFHSELMAGAKEKLKTVLDGIEIKEPVIDFISNLDAGITKDPKKIKENLINQLDNRTLWEASMKKAVSLGVTDFLEIGPGEVLKGLAKRIDPNLAVTPIHTPEDITGLTNSAG